MSFLITAVVIIEAGSAAQLRSTRRGNAASVQHHPRHRTTTMSPEPDLWDEMDDAPSNPSSTPKSTKTRQNVATTSVERAEASHALDTDAPSTAQQENLSDGMVELCKKPSFQVVLNPAENSRELRFGDDAEAATRLKGKPLVQSMVRCLGAPQASCLQVQQGCDLSPTRCPCEFRMDNLPPLDSEYTFMAREVLDAQEASLEHAAKDLTLRHAGAERWLGVEARDKMVNERNKAGSLWHVALVGLGGGMLPQYLLEHTQDLQIDAVESNPDVVDVARAFFGVARAESSGLLKVIPGDGLGFLENVQVESYNTVIVDCFGAGRIPEGCRSKDFVQAMYKSLKSHSDALQNVILRYPANQKLDGEVKKDFDSLLDNYYAAFGKEAVSVQRGHGTMSTNAVICAHKG